MKVYRIRHIPTRLYWQKAREGSNSLSKKGKVYLNKGTAERVLTDYVREIHLSRRIFHYDKLLEMVIQGKYFYTGKSIVGIPRKDWEVVEFNLIESKEGTEIIDFDGKCMAEIQIDDGKVRVLNAMDGWGNPIDLDKVIIEKI